MSRIWAIGASVRALAQSLVAAGHEVIAADLFNDLDLQRIARTLRIVDYPHDLLRLVDEVQADSFVYTGGLENYPDLIDALAAKLPLLGNPGEVLRRVRDVPALQAALNSAGFAMPEMQSSESRKDSDEGRWLRKSQQSSGGQCVHWADVHPRALRPGEYYQRFVEGTTYGASFIAEAGQVRCLGVAWQLTDCPWTNAPSFHYAGSIGPVSLPPTIQQEIERLGTHLAAEFQLQGWFGVDLIVDRQERIWVLEVNPRYTASMELLDRGRLSGKAVLYARQSLRVTSQLVERFLSREDVADIPCPGTPVAARTPLLTVFSRGEDEAKILFGLQRKAEELGL